MPKRLKKKPSRSTHLLDRISRAFSRHESLLIGLALGVILLVFASFAVVHRLVSGPQLRRWVNSDPEELLLDYEAGSSWVPGIIRLRGLTMRGSDENVQWWFRMEEVRISVSLLDLLRKRFHATSVTARGLVFRLREKEERRELSAAHLARVPKIPGFSDPPLKTVDRKPPPPPAAALPATTQPGPSLVLSVGNPQPGDLVPRGRLVMQGLAFDRAASQGSGVDKVSVFLDDRDTGGQHLGDATLGQPNAAGFTISADFSRASGKHTLFAYARSSVTGREAVLSFPISVGSR